MKSLQKKGVMKQFVIGLVLISILAIMVAAADVVLSPGSSTMSDTKIEGDLNVTGQINGQSSTDKPWFLAGGSSSQNWVGASAGTWTTVTLYDVRGNYAANYDTATGHWTAPETGLYYCFVKPYKSYSSAGYHHTISTCSGPTHTSNICGGFTSFDYTLGSQGYSHYDDSTGANSGLFYLETDDEIWWRIYTQVSNSYVYYPIYTRQGCVKLT